MNVERPIDELLNQIRERLLPEIAHSGDIQSTDNLHQFRSRLHSVHYYCTRVQLPSTVLEQVERLISTSAALWNLIIENEFVLSNLKEYTRVRTLSAEAEGITNLEELFSGEDNFRNLIINGIAFMLNWRANTIWVDSAKRARNVMTKNYMLEIQDRIWQFLKERTTDGENISLEQAEQVRQRADKFFGIIQASELPTEAQVALLLQIYTVLLRMQLGHLIIQLEALQDNPTD